MHVTNLLWNPPTMRLMECFEYEVIALLDAVGIRWTGRRRIDSSMRLGGGGGAGLRLLIWMGNKACLLNWTNEPAFGIIKVSTYFVGLAVVHWEAQTQKTRDEAI